MIWIIESQSKVYGCCTRPCVTEDKIWAENWQVKNMWLRVSKGHPHKTQSREIHVFHCNIRSHVMRWLWMPSQDVKENFGVEYLNQTPLHQSTLCLSTRIWFQVSLEFYPFLITKQPFRLPTMVSASSSHQWHLLFCVSFQTVSSSPICVSSTNATVALHVIPKSIVPHVPDISISCPNGDHSSNQKNVVLPFFTSTLWKGLTSGKA